MGYIVSKYYALAVKSVNCMKPLNLKYDEDLRRHQLKLLSNFGRNLKICKKRKTKWILFAYYHWYVTDGTWIIEFIDPSAPILVHCNPRLVTFIYIVEEFVMTDGILERMQKVCGTSNYSLVLRNCEHVARYVL